MLSLGSIHRERERESQNPISGSHFPELLCEAFFQSGWILVSSLRERQIYFRTRLQAITVAIGCVPFLVCPGMLRALNGEYVPRFCSGYNEMIYFAEVSGLCRLVG